MQSTRWFSFTSFYAVFLGVFLVASSPPESRLLKDLLRGYVQQERPVANSADPVVVKLGVSLQQIIDLLTVNMWLTYEWRDANLQWDPSEYGNVSDLRFPTGHIWTPDVLLYNSVDKEIDTTFKANLLSYSNGVIVWVPPGIFKTSCKLDIYYWPWDEQTCFFKFGSWSYSGRQIDLVPGNFSTAQYLENGEWSLQKVFVKREEKFYENEPFQSIQFFLVVRRRTLYYAFNLIMPCVLTMILVVLGFTLDPFSCEKVGLQISVSLAIVVFMSLMAKMTPQTSEAVPLLGKFYLSCMVISMLATGFTVYVQSIHYRCHSCSQRMGFWMRYFLLELMPYVLRIKQPQQTHTLKTVKSTFKKRNIKNMNEKQEDEQESNSNQFAVKLNGFVHQLQQIDQLMAERVQTLYDIYYNVQSLRAYNQEATEENQIRAEWQFAATVMDRMCLVLFTALMIGTGSAILIKAPYLVA